MLNVICVCTGDKYHSIYVDNLKYMIDKFSNLKYDTFNVILEDKHDGVFNKLQIFEKLFNSIGLKKITPGYSSFSPGSNETIINISFSNSICWFLFFFEKIFFINEF